MNRDKTLSCLIAGVLAFLISFGGAGCMVTGFNLQGSDLAALALICGLASLTGAVLSGRKWGGRVILGILALSLFFFLCSRGAREQLRDLIWQIDDYYYRAYGWEWLWRGECALGSMVWPLGLMGAGAAMLVSWTVVRRKDALAAVVAALLPLMTCLVVTDTVPREGFLYILILGILLLLLTAGLRQGSEEQGNTLALLAVIPTVLALGLLFLAVPQESYTNKVQAFYRGFLTWAEQYPALMEKLTGDSAAAGDGQDSQVDLQDAGPLFQRQYPVMDVVAPSSGTMYLRGRDYDYYDGTGWTATPLRAEILFAGWQWMEEQGTVNVAPTRDQDFAYVPYYSATGEKLSGGRAKMPEGIVAYGFSWKTLPENWRQRLTAETGSSLEFAVSAQSAAGMDERYLALPEDTRVWAETVLETILPEQEQLLATDKADIIAAYVCGSAAYDTDTPRMPRKRKDFVRWFLTESDSGYCVHFASATAVLLRAAGVPARYVTGYMFRAEAGIPVTVRADQAHAWVEYYEERLGMWLVLESTPTMPEAPSITILPQNRPDSSQETTEATLPDSTDATKPDASRPTEDGKNPAEGNEGTSPDGWRMPVWLKAVGNSFLWLAAFLAAVCGQRRLRLELRRKNAGTGSSNHRALARWRELELLYRRLGRKPPEELVALAQKARFSQHTLTAPELQTLDAGIRTARNLCREKPWYQRLIDQYFYAAY